MRMPTACQKVIDFAAEHGRHGAVPDPAEDEDEDDEAMTAPATKVSRGHDRIHDVPSSGLASPEPSATFAAAWMAHPRARKA